MKKIVLALSGLSLLAAGCNVRREGYQIIISSEQGGTVIEGLQIQGGLQSGMTSELSVIPNQIPTDTFSLPAN